MFLPHAKTVSVNMNGFFTGNRFRLRTLFYAPEGTSSGILKSHRPSVCPSVTNHVPVITKKTDKGNLIKLHRKIKQNEKVCCA